MADPRDPKDIDPLDRFRWQPGDVRPVYTPSKDGPLVSISIGREQARLLRTVLLDFEETFADCDEENDRVAMARRIVAGLDWVLAR